MYMQNVLQNDIQFDNITIRGDGDIMAIKSSNVTARVEPEIKDRAERILSELGISVSGGINMFYRQVILWNGLPFRPYIPTTAPKSISELSEKEFNGKMTRALLQAERGEGMETDEFFASLRDEVSKYEV